MRKTSKTHSSGSPRSGSRLNPSGRHTLHEILSQPETWIETTRRFEPQAATAEVFKNFSNTQPWLFTACGSSYYLSQTIAAQWTRLFGSPCTAVPASELLFAPEETLLRAGAKQVVLISRSGKTTEVLRAAELLQQRAGLRTLGVTCNQQSGLERLCTHTLKLPWADEKSMVMTRSFTSILLLFQRLGARFTGDKRLESALESLPEKTERWLAENADKMRAFGARRSYADYVFLGQGAHGWLAQEGALKMTEMSSSYAQAYPSLEFRHGPKSIASPKTLIAFLVSEIAATEELELAEEVKRLGATTLLVANRVAPELHKKHDLVLELSHDGPESARLALTAIPAQLLGLAAGVRKGLDPDVPRNLTRAVVLDEGGSATSRRRSG
ncbi:MAG TPA: SIS domain-containing protein [Candidatus Acidoferrum sp.]|nr:SIS domain-containing protein [Candidatus Acidoferrum sp.]